MRETRLAAYHKYAFIALRLAIVLIFIVFGSSKFTLDEAKGITPLVKNSPLVSWLLMIGIRDTSRVIGTAELAFGVLLATGVWRTGGWPAIVGAVGSCLTFLVTLSFLLTTPGIFIPGKAPELGVMGEFLSKDVVLLAASLLLLTQSLLARKWRSEAS